MKKSGLILAAAVGALFASSTFATGTPAAGEEAKVKCVGANACKGAGACKTATNACKGQNACKGHGWEMVMTEKECTDKGGKVEK